MFLGLWYWVVKDDSPCCGWPPSRVLSLTITQANDFTGHCLTTYAWWQSAGAWRRYKMTFSFSHGLYYKEKGRIYVFTPKGIADHYRHKGDLLLLLLSYFPVVSQLCATPADGSPPRIPSIPGIIKNTEWLSHFLLQCWEEKWIVTE